MEDSEGLKEELETHTKAYRHYNAESCLIFLNFSLSQRTLSLVLSSCIRF